MWMQGLDCICCLQRENQRPGSAVPTREGCFCVLGGFWTDSLLDTHTRQQVSKPDLFLLKSIVIRRTLTAA